MTLSMPEDKRYVASVPKATPVTSFPSCAEASWRIGGSKVLFGYTLWVTRRACQPNLVLKPTELLLNPRHPPNISSRSNRKVLPTPIKRNRVHIFGTRLDRRHLLQFSQIPNSHGPFSIRSRGDRVSVFAERERVEFASVGSECGNVGLGLDVPEAEGAVGCARAENKAVRVELACCVC